MYTVPYGTQMVFTVNMERPVGLNICGFSPMKFFTGILLWCLGQ